MIQILQKSEDPHIFVLNTNIIDNLYFHATIMICSFLHIISICVCVFRIPIQKGDLSSAVAKNQQGQTQIHRRPSGESGALRCPGRQRQQGDALH